MKLLLDTHALIWWLTDSARLSSTAADALEDPASEAVVSAASVWEIATKFRLGKLPAAAAIVHVLPDILREQGFQTLSISIIHVHMAGFLPGRHRDPFDRILAAQAIAGGMPLVTADPVFPRLGAQVLW